MNWKKPNKWRDIAVEVAIRVHNAKNDYELDLVGAFLKYAVLRKVKEARK